MQIIRRLLPTLLLAIAPVASPAFSLLGPFEPWMTTNLGFNNFFVSGTNDIGGPKNLGEGYRWNIPIITYGYDQSFLNYFGSNGVAAVESAIQVFNNLPPASETNINSFPLSPTRMNFVALQADQCDLKTAALGLIIEQLGLASPSRFIFTLRDYNSGVDPIVLSRNFDPITQEASPWLNGVLYTNNINYIAAFNVAFCQASSVDPGEGAAPVSVADYTRTFPVSGDWFTGLTRDDVGGLYYLYGTNNFVLENLIPGVQGAGTNAGNFVNLALRPGVGKITFQQLNYNSQLGSFYPVTLTYQDSYVANNVLQQQSLQRVVTQPDILFTAGDFGPYQFNRTGTSNWVNNGAPLASGPGVIQPPVSINFGKIGPQLSHADATYSGGASDFNYVPAGWASFDDSTNAPVAYPVDSTNENSTTVYFYLAIPTPAFAFYPPLLNPVMTLAGRHNEVFLLQTSTNLSDWSTITSVTNTGQEFTYFDNVFMDTPQRFFRFTPQ